MFFYNRVFFEVAFVKCRESNKGCKVWGHVF